MVTHYFLCDPCVTENPCVKPRSHTWFLCYIGVTTKNRIIPSVTHMESVILMCYLHELYKSHSRTHGICDTGVFLFNDYN